MNKELSGILPTATGSEVNRLSREDGREINNGKMDELLSARGVEYIRRVIAANIQAGCTVGVTSTFRVTPLRPRDSGSWEFPVKKVELPAEYQKWNRQLVEIAKEAYGERVVLGNISPITDTSESDDDFEFANVANGSTEGRIEFARRLHDAQIRILAESGVEAILVEACRHPDDAIAIARAATDNNIRNLIVSFEAEDRGVPDPIHRRSGYSFADMKEELEDTVGTGGNVLVGVNCIGSSQVAKLIAKGESIDVAYPNQSDPHRCPPSTVKKLRTLVNEAVDGDLRSLIRAELDEAAETPIPDFRSVWQRCLEARVQLIGICCGGRPEHVAAARNEWNTFHTQQEASSAEAVS